MEGNGQSFWATRLGRYTLWFIIWTSLGLLDAAHSCVRYAMAGDPVSWPRAVAMCLALWYGWAFLSLFIFRLARLYPVDQRSWAPHLVLHAVAAVFFANVKIALDYPVIELLYCPEPGLMAFPRFYGMAFGRQLHSYVLIYWAMLGVSHALSYYRQFRDRELRTAHLETRLAQAQLQCLKMQLHPHFLFNTLNAISALIHKDTELADRMLARLGDLLRLTLDQAGSHEVPLRQELDFIQSYLEIEQVRFGDRLEVRTQVDSLVLDACVPYLILQPLVENAIRHGVAPRGQGGMIEVFAQNVSGMLRLQVRDNGPGLPKKPVLRRRQGIGLSNTRQRLQQLYGTDHLFEIGNGPDCGVVVTIELPFRENPSGTVFPRREVALEGS